MSAGRAARACSAAIAAWTCLVEHEVDHRRDHTDPLGAFDRARRLERHLGARDPLLGARDALLHRRLADQERASDLRHGEARHDPQRERDLLGRRELGVAADEQQAQDVIAVVRSVEALCEVRLGPLEVSEAREAFLRRQLGLLAASSRGIDRRVAPDENQPGGRIARRAILRPRLECAQARVLERLLGDLEIAEVADQCTQRLGTGGRQRRIDPGEVGHVIPFARK